MNKRLLYVCMILMYGGLLAFSTDSFAQSNCTFDIKDYPPIDGKDCAYLLVLSDEGANGWDGASVDVAIGETATPTNYKVRVADGNCRYIPLYVNDGEVLDLTYWNGAFENEHGMALYDALGNLVSDLNGNDVFYEGDIPADTQLRVKVACPLNTCKDESDDFIVRITMGDFPEEQSWEIHEGPADVSEQGARVIGINANIYAGLAPGFQVDYPVSLDLCHIYTFVAFDGFNDGWDSGTFELIAYDTYGTPILDPSDSHYGKFLVFEGTGIDDETRREFTLPCMPICEDVLITNAVNCEITDPLLPISEAQICYPYCDHAEGCDITFQHIILPNGSFDDAIFGAIMPYTGTGSIIFAGTFPSGQHQLITKYTYCDEIMVQCTSDLNITSSNNVTMSCNDNVLISLNVPSSEIGIHTLGECIVEITPDMVLEMPDACEGDYEVTVFDAQNNPIEVYGPNGYPLDRTGNEILPGATTEPAHHFVGPDQLMQTLTYTVRHLGSQNTCWGTITIEDKAPPVIDCTDYTIQCTHPYALDEDYTHTEVYTAASELPANIAGGTGGLPSNTFIPINVPCAAMGEVIQDVEVNLHITHNELSDLSILLHLPADLDAALGGVSPLVLDTNVEAENTYTPSLSSAPALLDLISQACMLTTSTSPDDVVIETSGATLPANLGGTWYIQVIDNDAEFINNPYGGGEVTAASIALTCGFPFPSTGYDCSFEGIDLLSETIVETDCDQSNWVGAQVMRVWQAYDKYNNTSTCTQRIDLRAPTLDQIVKPGDISIECTDETVDVSPTVTGYPTFGCFDLTEQLHGLCDISYSYEDVPVPTCGLGYKIVRTWTFINWCSGVNHTHQQIIKVEDTEGPNISADNITVSTDPYSCAANLTLSNLGIEDNCSGVASVTVTYIASGTAYQSPTEVTVDVTNGEVLSDLPVGENEVTITATDACYNTTDTTIIIEIVDNVPPVAICDDELHVSLGNDGTARLYAQDVDEGSYDNCTDITLEVRRTDGCLGITEWSSYVPFDCCDVDTLVTVELRVTDAAGNTNTCWKSVWVEDALPPILTCPADKTLDCNDPALHNALGQAAAIDNCDVTITHIDEDNLDQCLAGTITRTFTASDASAKSPDATCTQTITVNHVSDFVVQFPADVTSNTCSVGEYGEPQISDDDCELVAVSHEDQIFYVVQDACYKIHRTWTIINWCIYDGTNSDNTDLGYPLPLPRTYRDDDGYFRYVQTIKVTDDVPPVITCPGDQTFCDLTDGCEGIATLTIEATDACTDDEALQYSYYIDANNDGSFDIVAEGNDASGPYPYGTHLIRWVVEDGCGNSSTCEYLFEINDCKKPTPVCLNGISIPNMESNGCVDIWASDLLQYAFDNCTPDSLVEASAKIRRQGDDDDAFATAITLCCEDEGTTLVDIWVEDEAGNGDFCTTYIILQDNNDVCDPALPRASVAGTIRTQNGNTVEAVEMVLTNTDIDQNTLTDTNGAYAFANVAMHQDYEVFAEMDVQPLNGVSTYDLVLMSQHILGIQPFDSPYTMIAADVNNDGNITTFDVVQLRQLILYVVTDFPSNTAWRFVDADYVFPNTSNPWMEAFPEAIHLEQLSQNQLNTDFVAVKIGDVNSDAIANSLQNTEARTAGTLTFTTDNQSVTKGEIVTIPFRARDFDAVHGFQFTLQFDQADLAYTGVQTGAIDLTDAHIGTRMQDEGVITASWNKITPTDTKVPDDAILFTMTFVALTDADLQSSVTISSRYTKAEAYQGNTVADVALDFQGTEAAESGAKFELYQNTPNPFSETTQIGFYLPEATHATLSVYDATGRVLYQVGQHYAQGAHQVNLRKADLNATGILYYELRTATATATKKMILVR